MVAFQGLGDDRWGDISGPGNFWVPLTLYHTRHFLFLCRRMDLLLPYSSPENTLAISVFCKKVEAPVPLVVRSQEGVLLRQLPEKAKNRCRNCLFNHLMNSIITLQRDTLPFNRNRFNLVTM